MLSWIASEFFFERLQHFVNCHGFGFCKGEGDDRSDKKGLDSVSLGHNNTWTRMGLKPMKDMALKGHLTGIAKCRYWVDSMNINSHTILRATRWCY